MFEHRMEQEHPLQSFSTLDSQVAAFSVAVAGFRGKVDGNKRSQLDRSRTASEPTSPPTPLSPTSPPPPTSPPLPHLPPPPQSQVSTGPGVPIFPSAAYVRQAPETLLTAHGSQPAGTRPSDWRGSGSGAPGALSHNQKSRASLVSGGLPLA